jgi:hypothetical protein
MNSDPDILPIEELPENLQESFRTMQEAIASKHPLPARKLMGELLEYYVAIDMEIPEDIEIAYAHLLLLENPPTSPIP